LPKYTSPFFASNTPHDLLVINGALLTKLKNFLELFYYDFN